MTHDDVTRFDGTSTAPTLQQQKKRRCESRTNGPSQKDYTVQDLDPYPQRSTLAIQCFILALADCDERDTRCL